MPICLMTAITITKAIGIDRKGNPYGFPVLIGGKDMFRKWLALVIGLLLTCSVTGYAASQQPYLLKSVLSIGVGETYVLGDVPDGTWSVSDSSIADVAEGRVIGKKNGTVTVTAQNAEGKAASCKVTVKQAPSEVKLSKSVLTLGVGESFRLSAIVPEGTAAAVRKFYTSNSHVLQMTKTDWTGKFTAVKPGVAYVTVRLYNGREASCKVTVKAAPSKVTISKGILSLGVGETYKLTASLPSNTGAATRTFRTSNSSVVKMTRTNWEGEFKAMKTGVAYVTVRLYNGKESTCKVTVKAAPAKVSLNKGAITMKVGQSASLSAIIPDNAGCAARTFRTSNSSIVKMTKTSWTGEFKALKKGVAYVTVRTYNGKEASCKVTVQ